MRISKSGWSLLCTGLLSAGLANPAMAQTCTTPHAVSTFAGMLDAAANVDGDRAVARLSRPSSTAVDAAGNIYVATINGAGQPGRSAAIRKITPAGVVSTLAGDSDFPRGLVDGKGSAARFGYVTGLATDSSANVYVTDGRAVRKITPDGAVTTLLGWVNPGQYDGPETDGWVANAYHGIAVDGTGNIYVSYPYAIRRISPAGTVTMVAGADGHAGSVDGFGTAARFDSAGTMAISASGDIFVADDTTIRKLARSGQVSTIVGQARTRGTDDGVGTAARLTSPGGLAIDSQGTLYLTDWDNYTIRRVEDASDKAIVTTIAGVAGRRGHVDAAGAAARFRNPMGLAHGRNAAGADVLYVTEPTAATVRAIGCLDQSARLVDGSFELPVLAAGGFKYNPPNGGWTFSGGAGVQANGSAWGAADAVDGAQTAFLQNRGAQIAQTFNLREGNYALSFHAARRAGQRQPISVSIDGMPLGPPITPAGNGFAPYTLPAVSLAAGSHTLEFRSVGHGPDNSSFIDAVRLRRTEAGSRHGLTFAMSADPSLPAGAAEVSCHGLPAPLDNPHRGSCNPYAGDTSCRAALPLLCFDPATGVLAATSKPVVGSSLGNSFSGAEECQVQGLSGRMAQFHDGGGWRIRGLRGPNLLPGTRYWVHITDQPGNCWDR